MFDSISKFHVKNINYNTKIDYVCFGLEKVLDLKKKKQECSIC